MTKIVVIGAGVVGLSAAVQLQEKYPNADITLVADKFAKETTSNGAAGIYRPTMHHSAGNDLQQMRQWSKDSWDFLHGLARSAGAAESGNQLVTLFNVSKDYVGPGVYSEFCLDYRELTLDQVHTWGTQFNHGYTATVVITQCIRYLPWLMIRFKEKGGKVEKRRVDSFDEFTGKYDIVVNCTGFGSRKLLGDMKVYPVRGQILQVSAPWIKHAVYENSGDGTYIIPCTDYVVVGGCREVNNFSTDVNEKQSEEIFEKACRFYPPLRGAKIIRSWAGLRPYREPIRVEKEIMNIGGQKLKVVHNYGHGGNGVCLSWGTSVNAVKMVDELLNQPIQSNL
ncbi:D-aspartate oxidase-like [Lineus longissimus]|uniref:D-aspartate oxidase-like n=1 Tax=Lineus longissimus TaxID=88925 RepID=UPI002B4E789C